MKIADKKINDMNELWEALQNEQSLYVYDWRMIRPTGFLRSLQFGYLATRLRGGIYHTKEDGTKRIRLVYRINKKVVKNAENFAEIKKKIQQKIWPAQKKITN